MDVARVLLPSAALAGTPGPWIIIIGINSSVISVPAGMDPARREYRFERRSVVVLADGPPQHFAGGSSTTGALVRGDRYRYTRRRCRRLSFATRWRRRRPRLFLRVRDDDDVPRPLARIAWRARGRRVRQTLRPAHALVPLAFVLHAVMPDALAAHDQLAASEFEFVEIANIASGSGLRRRPAMIVASRSHRRLFAASPCQVFSHFVVRPLI